VLNLKVPNSFILDIFQISWQPNQIWKKNYQKIWWCRSIFWNETGWSIVLH